jgi:hypothetical protein
MDLSLRRTHLVALCAAGFQCRRHHCSRRRSTVVAGVNLGNEHGCVDARPVERLGKQEAERGTLPRS